VGIIAPKARSKERSDPGKRLLLGMGRAFSEDLVMIAESGFVGVNVERFQWTVPKLVAGELLFCFGDIALNLDTVPIRQGHRLLTMLLAPRLSRSGSDSGSSAAPIADWAQRRVTG